MLYGELVEYGELNITFFWKPRDEWLGVQTVFFFFVFCFLLIFVSLRDVVYSFYQASLTSGKCNNSDLMLCNFPDISKDLQ